MHLYFILSKPAATTQLSSYYTGVQPSLQDSEELRTDARNSLQQLTLVYNNGQSLQQLVIKDCIDSLDGAKPRTLEEPTRLQLLNWHLTSSFRIRVRSEYSSCCHVARVRS